MKEPFVRKVETRFTRRAGKGRGIGLEEAVAAAEARLDTMRDRARDAIDQMMSQIEDQRPGVAQQSAAAMASVRGHAESLAGVAGMFGMTEVGQAALSLCQLFDAAASGPPSADAVRVHLDAFRMFRTLSPVAVTASAPAVLQGLEQVVAAAARRSATAA